VLPCNCLHEPRDVCEDRSNGLLLSVVSLWEMQVKAQLGKLSLDLPLAELVAAQQRDNRIEVLPVELVHVLALDDLPLHHRDPFDRLLIAQARVERAILVTRDAAFGRYAVETLW